MKRIFFAAALAVVATAQPVYGQDLTPDRFAFGIAVDTVGSHPVQSFVLPDTVYRLATRIDLGDIRLFNAAGEPLPLGLEGVREQAEGPPDRIALPFFPLIETPDAGAGDVRVDVRRSASGTLIRVDNTPPARDSLARAFVVDASTLQAAVNILTLTWDEGSADFWAEVLVETSDDLTRWQSWGGPATVAHLRRLGSVLTRNELVLPDRQARYYRVRFIGAAPPPLDRITVTLAGDMPSVPRRQVTLPMTRTGRGTFEAAHEGVYPVDRIQVRFERPNTLARVRIESADDPSGPWRRHYAGTAYRIEVDGRVIESPEIPIRISHNRYWRVVAGQGAEEDTALQPTLVLGWASSRVLFLARGDTPYTLAFGSGEVGPAAFQAGDLTLLTEAGLPAEARLGEVTTLGGEARRRVPMVIDWKTYLLWGALVAGVGLLALLAISLLRQVKQEQSAPPGEPH